MTKNTNKSLLPLGDKLILSHLIDSYPIDVPIVITVGYFGQKVIEETKKIYPNRDITFVTIDKYE
jgi:NDP-sugar pyrophosphorylase family protein